ncbi:hypothetical protein D9758_015106 [Tetrapyrgos nigripes]|uniref:Uncharacterized protein n=1 Tax=Tetrapyrgos nigripes TaxID=182062 RepID=A0A8H5BZX6_9AGAR|nr:hypothetical protein D9758_015106 [Tetrapyrgos nigripes]
MTEQFRTLFFRELDVERVDGDVDYWSDDISLASKHNIDDFALNIGSEGPMAARPRRRCIPSRSSIRVGFYPWI